VPVPTSANLERIKLWVEVTTGMELADEQEAVLDAATWRRRRERLLALGGSLPGPGVAPR
jgi:hypothetical protein